jgi:hypothetical protein
MLMQACPRRCMFVFQKHVFLLLYYANAMIILYYSGNFIQLTDNVKLLFTLWYPRYVLVRSSAGIGWKVPGRVTVYPSVHRSRGR